MAEKKPQPLKEIHYGLIDKNQQQKEKTQFGRFFQKITQLFKKEPNKDHVLLGRIQEIEVTANKVMKTLMDLKVRSQGILSESFFSLLSSMIDPLLKDLARMEKLKEKEDSAMHQVKIFHHYVEWIEKAKGWTLLNEQCDEMSILEEIKKQTIHAFEKQIQRDIQLIQDYLHHHLENHPLSEEVKLSYLEIAQEQLEAQFIKLNQLQEGTDQLNYNSLKKWKKDSDKKRQAFFGKSLQIIDTLNEEWMPVLKVYDEEHLPSKELEIQVLTLEEKVFDLLENKTIIDEKESEKFQTRLRSLDEEAHSLNANLRLTPEQSDRMEVLLNQLAKFQL